MQQWLTPGPGYQNLVSPQQISTSNNTSAVLLNHMTQPIEPYRSEAHNHCYWTGHLRPFWLYRALALTLLKNVMRGVYLLGVKANLCLHNSQYSFLLCLSHCTKLWKHKRKQAWGWWSDVCEKALEIQLHFPFTQGKNNNSWNSIVGFTVTLMRPPELRSYSLSFRQMGVAGSFYSVTKKNNKKNNFWTQSLTKWTSPNRKDNLYIGISGNDLLTVVLF